jgi:hypothetical protein
VRIRQAAGGGQRTLRALIDWSCDLLSAPERLLFERLSVFAGGWTLEAAEAISAGGAIDRADAFDLLARLMEKSLVAIVVECGRYRMLDTVRRYAAERQACSGEEASTRERHLEHYAALVEAARPNLLGPDQGLWMAKLDQDWDNILAAHAACDLSPTSVERDPMLVAALKCYWLNRGPLGPGLRITVPCCCLQAGADRRRVGAARPPRGRPHATAADRRHAKVAASRARVPRRDDRGRRWRPRRPARAHSRGGPAPPHRLRLLAGSGDQLARAHHFGTALGVVEDHLVALGVDAGDAHAVFELAQIAARALALLLAARGERLFLGLLLLRLGAFLLPFAERLLLLGQRARGGGGRRRCGRGRGRRGERARGRLAQNLLLANRRRRWPIGVHGAAGVVAPRPLRGGRQGEGQAQQRHAGTAQGDGTNRVES